MTRLLITGGTLLDRSGERPGDVAIEDAATEHAWVNTTDEPVIVLTAHVIPRP